MTPIRPQDRARGLDYRYVGKGLFIQGKLEICIESAHVKECEFQNPGNIYLWKLESGKILLYTGRIETYYTRQS